MTKLWKDDDCVGGRYRLMRELGRDRGTVLWEAHDDEEMEIVHLRLLQGNLRSEPLVVMRFRREADLASRLDHRALVAARGVVDDEDALALVYDRAGTKTLNDRLREGPVEAAEAAVIIEPILEGLHVAHRRGVIHRNLSPGQIWLDDDGGVRLAGFGGARVLDMVGLTTQSMAFGISHYRAPEQWLAACGHSADADPRTDVWALGVILFEMVTGRLPVGAAGPRAMLEVFNELDVAEELGELANTPLGRAIAGALVVDRGERISSVRAMADMLLGRHEIARVTKIDGVPCWNCEKARIPDLHFCLRCGAEPLVRNPGTGNVDLIVPKFRRGQDKGVSGRRFEGCRNLFDLFFFRSFKPHLDVEEKVVLKERLERAHAQVDANSENRMAYSPFRLVEKLTPADAYRLKTYLATGQAPEPPDEEPWKLSNPQIRMDRDELPILYNVQNSKGPRVFPGWSLKGVSWSSPLLFTIFGAVSVISTALALLAMLSMIFSGVFLDFFGLYFIVGIIAFATVAPIWIALVVVSRRNRRPAITFEAPREDLYLTTNRERWQVLIGELGNERDRGLVEQVLGELIYHEDFVEEIEEDVVVLGRAPGDDEWQNLQVAWEGLEARQEQGAESGAILRERRELVEQMRRHEKATEESDLARARLFDVLENFRSPPGRVPEVDDHGQTRAGFRAELEELRILHESLLALEENPLLDVIDAARERVDLDLDLPQRFDVIRPIATGGMASVVLAYDHYREEEVALKIVLPHLRSLPQIGELMWREFEAARRVRHPGLVAIYEHLQVEGVDVLVMEYARGVDLKSTIRWRGALPPGEVRQLAGATLEALAAAHQSGVIHGDIKPANIVVGPEGDVKLVDFGLARMEYLARDEQMEARLGTPGYVAPEILEGILVDERADIYGLGLTIYEALTGRLPFGDGEEGPVAGSDFEEVEAGLHFRDILKRASSRDPSRRFRSAQEMKAALTPGGQGLQSREVADGELCHGCGAERSEFLRRCLHCGARRHQVVRVSRFIGRQVLVESRKLDGQRRRKALNGDDVEAIRQVVREFQNVDPAPHFEESLSELPVLLTPPVDKEDALAMARALEQRGFRSRVLPARFGAPVFRARGALGRILSSSLPLLALTPLIVVIILFLAVVYVEQGTLLSIPLILSISATACFLAMIIMGSELLPVLRSATKVGAVWFRHDNSGPDFVWEDRAIEAFQRARTERTRSLIEELVQVSGELRQAWEGSGEFGDLVENVDSLVARSFDEVDALIDAEAEAGEEGLGEARFKVVRIGSALLSLIRKMRELREMDFAPGQEALGEMGTVLDFGVDDFDPFDKNDERQSEEENAEVVVEVL